MIAAIFVAGIFLWQNRRLEAKSQETVARGLNQLESMEKKDYSGVETQIQALEDAEKAAEEKAEAIESGKGVEDDLYNTMTVRDTTELQKAFEGSIILGDSVVEAIDGYGYLPANEVVYKRGVSVHDLDELIATTIGLNPKCVFFQMGINDMDTYNSDTAKFVEEYKNQIQTLKQGLPNVQVYVNNVNPVQDFVLESHPGYRYQADYNVALKAMCEEIGVTFIDNSSLINAHEEFFDDDGIHPLPEYYPYWLTHMANVAGL